MPTFGALVADAPVQVEFGATDNGLAHGGVTMYVLRPGRVMDVQGFTGSIPPFELTLPRAATRLVVHANPSVAGGTVSVKVEQFAGRVLVFETVQEDATFVFDIV